MSIEVTINETKTVKFAVPATQDDTAKIITAMCDAVDDGYSISSIAQVMSGDQRDAYVTGATITFKKED